MFIRERNIESFDGPNERILRLCNNLTFHTIKTILNSTGTNILLNILR